MTAQEQLSRSVNDYGTYSMNDWTRFADTHDTHSALGFPPKLHPRDKDYLPQNALMPHL